MIRVFNENDRDFSTNGDIIIEPIKSKVRNKLNDVYEYELTCGIEYTPFIKAGKLLLVDEPNGVQAFRIAPNISVKNNRLEIKAKHVYYDADNLVIADSYVVNKNCDGALKHLNSATDTTSPFTVSSNVSKTDSYRCVRETLLEAINVVLERWGGNLVRNNWDIKILGNIGKDNGINIRYGVNLQDITVTDDWSGVVTKVLPVGANGVLLPELYVMSAVQYAIPYTKVISFSQDLEQGENESDEAFNARLVADLRQQAQKYVNTNCVPVVQYTLKGKPDLVTGLGDLIRVYDERIGVDITTQVIGYEYDTITESYASLTFGNFTRSISNLMGSVKAVANEEAQKVGAELNTSINKVYDLLQKSYVVYRGYDILVLDRIPISSAVNVLKFTNQGIQRSTTGADGSFKTIYSLATDSINVSSIVLNGKNLQTVIDNTATKADLDKKQDKLVAGDGITINRNIISSTKIVANPSGRATATLNSIQIGSTIYNLPSGGTSTNARISVMQGATSVSREGRRVIE